MEAITRTFIEHLQLRAFGQGTPDEDFIKATIIHAVALVFEEIDEAERDASLKFEYFMIADKLADKCIQLLNEGLK